MPQFKRKPLEGVFALTPLCVKADQEIDYDAIAANIEWLDDKGLQGFIQFGCMGQMSSVSEAEFNKVCDVAAGTAARRRIAAVISATATYTQEAVRRATYSEDAGADGSMLAVPYAFPVVDEWAVEFFTTVDAALKGELALMLYNYPPLTGYNITPALWKRSLLGIKSIKASKDSNPESHHHDEALILLSDQINWFSSRDAAFWHDSMLGAKGIVGILTWVAPKAMLKYYEECCKGNQMGDFAIRAFKAAVAAWGAMKGPGMPPLLAYEHGYLNALVEIGGAIGGPPRKPYNVLPGAARERLEDAVRPLLALEAEVENGRDQLAVAGA